jgi:hypothetical protein
MLITVTIKFNDPKIDEIPEMCNDKIAKSIETVSCPISPDRGGYNVHPVPGPDPTKNEQAISKNEKGKSQKLKLLRRGKAISTVPHINGINQLPNPLIKMGITAKKIITTACDVTTVLKNA